MSILSKLLNVKYLKLDDIMIYWYDYLADAEQAGSPTSL
jgi:hypothetical protein